MGCGTSKEAVVSSDGSGRCSRKLFRRKSSVVATGAHQPVAAAKDNGDVVTHHKEKAAPEKAAEKGTGKACAAAPIVKGGDEVASTVIAAKVVGEKKAGEEIKKDGEKAAVAGADDATGKETADEKIAGEKKDEGVRDKEVVAGQIKDDVASATGSVVIVEEEEEGTENGEPVEVSVVADERDDGGVSSAGANDDEGWSTEKDIEEIAVEEDDSTVTYGEAPVGVAIVEDDGVVVSADAPANEEGETTAFPAATVAGDNGSVGVVAEPVAKEDELASFASAPLADEVDGIILPSPVADEVDVATFEAAPVTKEAETVNIVDAPVAKDDETVTVQEAPVAKEGEGAATVAAAPAAAEDEERATAPLAKEDETVTVAVAPAVTGDEGVTTVDDPAPKATNEVDETVTSWPAAPVTNVDERLTLPASTTPVSEEEVVEAAEQPTPSGNDDGFRNDQELPEPTVAEEVAIEAEDKTSTEQVVEATAEVVTLEKANSEPEEAESVVPREPEEAATSAAASRYDDGESNGKQAVDSNDAANADQEKEGEEQLTTVEENNGVDEEQPAVAPVESPSS